MKPSKLSEGRAKRAMSYMFTINFGEGTEPHQLTPEADRWDERGVRYCRWQLEVGETGTLHIQGYLELFKQQTIVWVRNQVAGLELAHLDARAGTAQQADAYCSKVETRVDGPWTYGVSCARGCWLS